MVTGGSIVSLDHHDPLVDARSAPFRNDTVALASLPDDRVAKQVKSLRVGFACKPSFRGFEAKLRRALDGAEHDARRP